MEKTYIGKEVAEILNVSEMTVRARRQKLKLGVIKGHTAFYTVKEILLMIPKEAEGKIGRPWPGKSKDEVKEILKSKQK
jgi:DNA-binding Lrp family transcriptional regulator